MVVRAHEIAHVFPHHAKLVGQICPTGLNPVLKLRNAGVEAGFTGVNPFFKSLETASDGNGEVVGVLLEDTLEDFEVFVV